MRLGLGRLGLCRGCLGLRCLQLGSMLRLGLGRLGLRCRGCLGLLGRLRLRLGWLGL